MASAPIRIAMWSGPRNISTAMMRAWENRADTNVVDEPFYACYLTATGIEHPMQQQVLASQSSDWAEVITDVLSAPLTPPAHIQYQKHMTQHMVGPIDPNWFASLTHAFLIRHPAQVVASYREKRGSVTADDIGFAQQRKLFELAQSVTDAPPPVIESSDVLKNPKQALSALCKALDLAFDEAMLQWPAGRRASDGVWAPHWYHAVEASTGFAPYQAKTPELSAQERRVVSECLDDYYALQQYALG